MWEVKAGARDAMDRSEQPFLSLTPYNFFYLLSSKEKLTKNCKFHVVTPWWEIKYMTFSLQKWNQSFQKPKPNMYKNTNNYCYCAYFLSILFMSQQNMWCFLTEHFIKFEQHLFFEKSNVQHLLKSSYSLSSYYLKHMSWVFYSYYLLFLLHFRLLF